jgi:hypothetical protein
LTLTAVLSRLSPDVEEAIEVCVALYKAGLFVEDVWMKIDGVILAVDLNLEEFGVVLMRCQIL